MHHGVRRWAEVTSRPGQPGHPVVVLVIAEDMAEEIEPIGLDPSGYYLRAYDLTGALRIETWHGAIPDAMAWAEEQYGRGLVEGWHAVPETEPDAFAFASKRR